MCAHQEDVKPEDPSNGTGPWWTFNILRWSFAKSRRVVTGILNITNSHLKLQVCSSWRFLDTRFHCSLSLRVWLLSGQHSFALQTQMYTGRLHVSGERASSAMKGNHDDMMMMFRMQPATAGCIIFWKRRCAGDAVPLLPISWYSFF